MNGKRRSHVARYAVAQPAHVKTTPAGRKPGWSIGDGMMGPGIVVYIADDDEVVRSALRLILEKRLAMVVSGEAENWTALLNLVRNASPNLLLLDWELPGLPIPGWRERLDALNPGAKVLALSGRPEAAAQALASGAHAFTSKAEPPEKLVETIRGMVPTYTRP
jgi:DNA-binding NarL/FixJ family response regulator